MSIASPVVSATTLYLNLTYTGTGCPALTCQAIVASGDGGQTWAQVPNQANIQLMYVVGTTLYGQRTEGATTTIMLSYDHGASWTTLTLPPLPGGQTLNLGDQGAWLPAPGWHDVHRALWPRCGIPARRRLDGGSLLICRFPRRPGGSLV